MQFKYLRSRSGPFHSRTYRVTLFLGNNYRDQIIVHPDFFNPFGGAIEDFGLSEYTALREDYLRVRDGIVHRRDFEVCLVIKEP